MERACLVYFEFLEAYKNYIRMDRRDSSMVDFTTIGSLIKFRSLIASYNNKLKGAEANLDTFRE